MRCKTKLNVVRCVCLFVATLPLSVFAQKVRVGYDKGTDFVKFRSFSWEKPTMPITRPLLFKSVVGSIDMDLKSKGLARVDRDGDLLLIPAGAMEFGLNAAAGTPILPTYGGPPPIIDASRWMGAGASQLMATYVPEGTLVLTFIDRASNKIVWTGTVTEKLDNGNKKKSLERVDKAIAKLLKQFPPKP